MSSRKRLPKNFVQLKPYWWAPHIVGYDSLEFNKDIIKPGDKVRIKGRRGIFTFRGWYHNTQSDSQWLDLVEDNTGHFRSFHVGTLRSVIRPKRSRRKKIV